jgi:hypothetical protein
VLPLVLALTLEVSVVVPLTCVELYVVSVAGLTVVELVVEDTPAVSVEDLVVWLQPLRIRPRSATIKTEFFIGD